MTSTTLPSEQAATAEVARLQSVSKQFRVRIAGGRHGTLQAVDDVDLVLHSGRTVGLVGESGSGKSTIARLLLRLVDPSSGRVVLDGQDITALSGRRLREVRSRMQLVFQDPYSSFDPRTPIDNGLAEALRRRGVDRSQRPARCEELLELVGLSPTLGSRRPRELSGGQLQRAAIARALAMDPALIALDEPVSSLDVSSQVHVIDLLNRLQVELGVSMLFISHDLTVVRDVCQDVAVMYLGRIVEDGPTHEVYTDPTHPYTRSLLDAAPRMQRHEKPVGHPLVDGDIPSPLAPPSGCRFHTRCPVAIDRCADVDPPVRRTGSGVRAACHLVDGEPETDATLTGKDGR